MKMTTKNLAIVLLVLVAAFAVVQLTSKGGRSKSLRSELVNIDTSKVSRIAVISSEEEVQLNKSEEGWMVSLANSTKQTKDGAVANLLTSLSSIKPGRLAAKSPEKWKDFQVDSAGTRVQVYEGDVLSTDIVIGRFGVEGQQSFYTFVRLFEDDEVYTAPNFMGISVGKDAASYRDNAVLTLKKDSLSAITFNYPDSSFQLLKDNGWFINGAEADSASVAEYLAGIRSVTSKEFFDDGNNFNTTLSVSFSFTDQPDITVEASTGDGRFLIRSSENKEETFEDINLMDKLFKGLGDFQ